MNSFYLLLAFMAVMSLISFVLMGKDKKLAKLSARRIPEKRLFFFAAFGGGIGGYLGMKVFHHKTKHWYFAVFFPLFALFQIAAAAYLYYLVH